MTKTTDGVYASSTSPSWKNCEFMNSVKQWASNYWSSLPLLASSATSPGHCSSHCHQLVWYWHQQHLWWLPHLGSLIGDHCQRQLSKAWDEKGFGLPFHLLTDSEQLPKKARTRVFLLKTVCLFFINSLMKVKMNNMKTKKKFLKKNISIGAQLPLTRRLWVPWNGSLQRFPSQR